MNNLISFPQSFPQRKTSISAHFPHCGKTKLIRKLSTLQKTVAKLIGSKKPTLLTLQTRNHKNHLALQLCDTIYIVSQSYWQQTQNKNIYIKI